MINLSKQKPGIFYLLATIVSNTALNKDLYELYMLV